MKLSAILCSRNDNYGGFLNERAIIALSTMLDTFDEVIYVDWNSEKINLIDAIKKHLPKTGKLRYFVISPEQHKQFTNNDPNAQKVVEVLARNIGIRRATGDILVSTNIDIVVPRRVLLDRFLTQIYRENYAYTFARRNVDIPWDELYTTVDPFKLRDELESNMFLFNPKGIENGYSRVLGCGDFQLAKKEHWFKVKGFEEDMIYRMVADSQVQMKMMTNKIPVAGLFDYPLFHINHDMKISGGGGPQDGKVNRNFRCACIVEQTKNSDTWGFSDLVFEEFRL